LLSVLLHLPLFMVLLASSASAQATFDWVVVGRPGNSDDLTTGVGAVSEAYRISKFEITNAEYAEFLNAVADTDTNALYNTSMGSGFGGIARSGNPGSFTYSAIAGRERMPVNYVSFWDATRFANWLHNGQPTGAQANTTTEDGAYALTPIGITNNTVTRNIGAAVFLPSEDEWYKAAYYDTASTVYFDFPAGSDTPTTCTVPGTTANTANCDNAVVDSVDVGSYTASPSPNDTFDQGGSLWEWNELLVGSFRDARGGSFVSTPFFLRGSHTASFSPTAEIFDLGFRVASLVPEAVPSLSPLGLAMLWSLLGLAGWWRLQA
jgi:formylglycine-generating enzyme required for sulfatase activity